MGNKDGKSKVRHFQQGSVRQPGQVLRGKAEAIDRENMLQSPENIEILPPEETQRMLHELRVHQIELEIQNEELRTKQAELDIARNRYFNLYDLAPVGYCTLSEEGLILEANLAAADMMGIARHKLIKQPLSRFIPPEYQNTYYFRRKQLRETGKPQKCELRIIKNDATLFWAHLTATVIEDIDTAPINLIVLNDITERKQAEMEKARLEAQNQQLHKTESLGRMAGAIAHHFNNQLYAVMGNLEMAMDDLPLGVDSNENLVSAMQAAIKAADVSRLMLTYLGQTPGKHEPIDLSETCRQNLTLLQAAAPEGMILNADFPSSGPIINADAGQMQQILTNLVTNAWEATSDNRGTICLTVKTVSHEDIPASKRFPIDWQPQEIDFACLEVSDTGSGIANKDIEKIFDPFFTTKFTGRGLGLPVVMGIVKAHGGGVTVESEPRRGSVFRIFLPVSTEELPIQHDLPAISEALPTSKTHTLSKIESGGTVLLIEDEDPVRNMSKKMLTRLGYKVLEAKDGVEAVEMFLQHQDKICFVLSDLTMPRMDGWDTLAALRKLSPCIPVVLSSGYDEAQVMAGEHSEHPNAFLGKPYQLKGLRETIKRVLTNMS
jgi:PAS domain S-box-containing protein